TNTRWSLDTFHLRVIQTMRWLVENFHAHDAKVVAQLDPMCDLLLRLPAPTHASYIQPDIGSNQFLTDGQRRTPCGDTEACVIAPPVLDFIGLEFQIPDQTAADAFAHGYGTFTPLPLLNNDLRMAYRYLYFLLEVEGDIPLNDWLNFPTLFA